MAYPGWHSRARTLCALKHIRAQCQFVRFEKQMQNGYDDLVINGGENSPVERLSGSRGGEFQFVLQLTNPLLTILKRTHLFVGKTGEGLLREHLDLLIEDVQKFSSERQGRSTFHGYDP